MVGSAPGSYLSLICTAASISLLHQDSYSPSDVPAFLPPLQTSTEVWDPDALLSHDRSLFAGNNEWPQASHLPSCFSLGS